MTVAGLVTRGKYAHNNVCYAYASTAVLETCYLKATVGTKEPKPDQYDPKSIAEFQNGLNLFPTFGIACKKTKETGLDDPTKRHGLGQTWKYIAYVKRLSGMPPSRSDWEENEGDCLRAIDDMDQWKAGGADGAYVVSNRARQFF